jgi:hypothetical protein
MATIKHASEMNDVILNWKKLKKFIKSETTDNEINGKEEVILTKKFMVPETLPLADKS